MQLENGTFAIGPCQLSRIGRETVIPVQQTRQKILDPILPLT